MTKTGKELLFAAAIMLISVLLTAQSFRYPAESSAFPRFLCVLMLAFSCALSVKCYTQYKKETSKEDRTTVSISVLNKKIALIVFGLTLMYILGITYVGYFSSSILFLIVSMAVLSKKQNWIIILLATLGFLALVYGLFVIFLGLSMPRGLLL